MNHLFVLVSSNVGVLSSITMWGGNRGICEKGSCVSGSQMELGTSRLAIASAEGEQNTVCAWRDPPWRM